MSYKIGDKIRTKGHFKHTIKKWIGCDCEEYEIFENKYIWKTDYIMAKVLPYIDSYVFNEFRSKCNVAWYIHYKEDAKTIINILKDEGILIPVNLRITNYTYIYYDKGVLKEASLEHLLSRGYSIFEIESPKPKYRKSLYQIGDKLVYKSVIVTVEHVYLCFSGNKYNVVGAAYFGHQIHEDNLKPLRLNEQKLNIFQAPLSIIHVNPYMETTLMYHGYEVEKLVAFYNKYKDLAAAIEKLNKPSEIVDLRDGHMGYERK